MNSTRYFVRRIARPVQARFNIRFYRIKWKALVVFQNPGELTTKGRKNIQLYHLKTKLIDFLWNLSVMAIQVKIRLSGFNP